MKIVSKIKKIIFSKQESVMSAATLIMVMIVASRFLGLVRQRILAHFFTPNDLSLFFAAFRLPDTIFEVLVFGTFASAFIPVFTRTLKGEKSNKKAWELASLVTSWGMLIFIVLASIVVLSANPLYKIITPGFAGADQKQVVYIARILFAAQGFFVLSYVLTAVLESSKRFFVPALAPLFYNLGIIISTIFLSEKIGLLAPTLGVVVGAAMHFMIQLPLAVKLGYKFKVLLAITPEVRKIAKLSLPRIIEVSFLQIAKFVELTLASLISVPAYTYFTFGNSIQLLPVGLFGTSIAKAALPTLSHQADDISAFRKTLYETLNQIVFLMAPIISFMVVARIPIVRLVFGTDLFTWESTVQTSLVISAFAVGVFSQAANSILARSFYAMHDTKTPVKVSVVTLTINIILDFILVVVFKLPVWSLAAAFSAASVLQSAVLFFLMTKRIHNGVKKLLYIPVIKSFVAALGSGFVMFFFLKFFDRSVWIKRLSFVSSLDLPFEKFVLDTRYAGNLLLLTAIVGLLGVFVYVFLLYLLKSKELFTFVNLIKRNVLKNKMASISPQGTEDTSY